MPLSRLDHVQLAMPAGREDDARAFYVGLLGFTELPKPAELAGRGGAWFACGKIALHVGVEDDFRPARKAHPALRCTEYDAFVEALQAAGIPVVADPLPFDGMPHAYIADPFGNRLELIAEAREGVVPEPWCSSHDTLPEALAKNRTLQETPESVRSSS